MEGLNRTAVFLLDVDAIASLVSASPSDASSTLGDVCLVCACVHCMYVSRDVCCIDKGWLG